MATPLNIFVDTELLDSSNRDTVIKTLYSDAIMLFPSASYEVKVTSLPLKPLITVTIDENSIPLNVGDVPKTLEEKIDYCNNILKPKFEKAYSNHRFMVIPSVAKVS